MVEQSVIHFVLICHKIPSVPHRKIQHYLEQYEGEFSNPRSDELWCLLCTTKVDHTRKSSVKNHRNSDYHVEGIKRMKKVKEPLQCQTFLTKHRGIFMDVLTKAFMSAEIPLYKLRNPHLMQFLSLIGNDPPSESTVR